MLGNEAQAATSAKLLDPISAANTAAATSGWVDVRDAEGDVMVTAQVGALTGAATGIGTQYRQLGCACRRFQLLLASQRSGDRGF